MRLCLNMIVKNEAAILERCLASVAPHISTYAIVDTGSTDGTPALIRAFFEGEKGRGIRGAVTKAPFVDFSQARNAALDAARILRHEQPHDYVLLADADMQLVATDPAWADKLTAPAYALTQEAGISYSNVRLVRSDLLEASRYREPTHEYLDVPGFVIGDGTPPLAGVHFIDHADGGSRGDKYTRDERLLKAALLRDPENARALYYLAQTYRDMGRYQDAATYYRRRIGAGGWEEEIWHAAYRLAECLRLAGDEQGFVMQALAAYQRRPSRGEPLHALSAFFRNRGEHETALVFARAGGALPKPPDHLFVEDFIYRHGFRHEVAVSGFFAASAAVRAEGYEACQALALDRGLSGMMAHTAAWNTTFYCKSAREAFGESAVVHGIELAYDPVYTPMNPSIYVEPDGQVKAIVRCVNYKIDAGQYTGPVDGVTRTKNVLCDLVVSDDALVVVRAREIVDLAGEGRTDFPVQGYEDCRLFRWQDRLWASATVRDRREDGRAEIALLALEDAGDAVAVTSCTVLRGPWSERDQKNWVPLVPRSARGEDIADEGHTPPPIAFTSSLWFLYETDPTAFVRVDPYASLRCDPSFVLTSDPAFAGRTFRGSSQAIPMRDGSGYLYVVHEAFDEPGATRLYTHRLVQLDSEARAVAVSDPFYFLQKGIEFCAGLARQGDKLLFSFGVHDEKACVLVAEESAVLSWLQRKRPEESATP